MMYTINDDCGGDDEVVYGDDGDDEYMGLINNYSYVYHYTMHLLHHHHHHHHHHIYIYLFIYDYYIVC
jgi:hypothetical protein